MTYPNPPSNGHSLAKSGSDDRTSSSSINDDVFDDLECLVVHLSRSDSLKSLGDKSGLCSRFMRWFGTNTANPLANRRLEALRRFAVLMRVRGTLDEIERDQFLAAGYTIQQREKVEGVFSANHQAKEGFSLFVWTIALCGAVMSYIATVSVVQERAPALIVAGVVLITLASLARPGKDSR